MTEDEIHYVIRQFIDAAVRAKRAGFDGVLFRQEEKKNTDTVMIGITGIHGNFYSNPFYYNIGDTLNSGNIDFIYAQTNDAFGQIETINVNTGKKETIGSWNERFFLLSPANLTYMMSGVTAREKQMIKDQVECGDGDKMLPFPFMGWVECIANTAYDWQFSSMLNNVHTAHDGDFTQAEKITYTGAMLVGTYDNFTDGDPSDFLRNLNAHMPTADQNKLIFIEKTGHTYQMKNQEVADDILAQLNEWTSDLRRPEWNGELRDAIY